MVRFVLLSLAAVLVSFPAMAGGSSVSIGIGVSSGGYHHHGWRDRHYRSHHGWGHRHYRHHRHYRPRTTFFYSAPIYVAPPPPRTVYYPPPVVVAPPPVCRTYNGDAVIDSSGRPFFGTACLQSDGRWHIVP